MTTQDIVDAPAAVTRGRLLINIAEGIETEDMPCPIAITFYEKDSPGWDRVDTLSISFADSRDLSIWVARLGWTVTIAPTPSHDGSRLIHSAHGDFHGWKVSANATDPIVHAGPSTEEPERTLTAVERDRYMMATTATHVLGDISRDEPDLALVEGEDGEDYIGRWLTGLGYVNVRFPKATTRPLNAKEIAYYRTRVLETPMGVEPVLPADYDASAEDRHETTVVGTDTTGWTWQCTCGHSAPTKGVYHFRRSAEYDARQHEQQSAPESEPVTDAAEVIGEMDAKAREAAEL